MSRYRRPILALLVVLLAVPAIASEKGFRCTDEVQVCLNKMVAKLKKRGWVGIEYDDQTGGKGGYRVLRVVPGSPAEAAGLQAGDLLLALNGRRLTEPMSSSGLAKESQEMRPGGSVQYTILRGGKERVVTVVLAALPSDVMAQILGMHMLEHAQISAADY